MLNTALRVWVLALLTIFLLALGTNNATALVYSDLGVVYSENFDDDLSMSALVPQVDVFGAGRLYENDIGNGPLFTPVSLESAPLIPRGAARATITNSPGSRPYEIKVALRPP